MVGMRDLKDCLAEYPPVMLEAIAEGWHIVFTDEQTPEMVDRLVAEMSTPANLQSTLQRLSEIEREALSFVAARGETRAYVVVRKYGDLRRFGPGSLEWKRSWRQPASAIERLWFLGLLHVGYAKAGQFHGQVFFVPREIRAILPPVAVPAPKFEAMPLSTPAVIRDETDALARGVLALLSHCRNTEVRPQKGTLPSRELAVLGRRLRPVLQMTTAEQAQRLRFLQHVAERTGWLRVQDGLWKPTLKAAHWLKKSALGRQIQLYHAWLEDATWNELWMMPSVHCEETGWRNDPLLARTGVLARLGQCPTETWLGIDSFVEFIYDFDPDFMRPDGDYSSWYIRDVETQQYLTGFSNWHKVEGAVIRYILSAPLCWLGLIALGFPQKEMAADRFMLTRMGAAVLGLLEEEATAAHPFLVQTDGHVIVPHNASWYDRFLLERFARWVDEDPGFARYVLDASSVRICLRQGIDIDQVLAFLRRVTHHKLPDSVTRALKAHAQRLGNPVDQPQRAGRKL